MSILRHRSRLLSVSAPFSAPFRAPFGAPFRAPLGALVAAVLGVLLACSDTSAAPATEIVPDQVYESGTALVSSEAGVTFTVPEGWRASFPSGAQAMILERIAGQALVVLAADEADEAMIRGELSSTQHVGHGVRLEPVAEPERGEDGVFEVEYAVLGSATPGAGAGFGRVGPHGVAIAVVAYDISGQGIGRDAAFEIARGVRFTKPAGPATSAAQTASSPRSWEDYLRGRYIARFYSGSGYHEKEELWLCSDGRFRRSSDAGGYGGGASGAYAGRGAGRWSASGDRSGSGALRLAYDDGEARFTLALVDGDLHLNGKRWLRGDNEICD